MQYKTKREALVGCGIGGLIGLGIIGFGIYWYGVESRPLIAYTATADGNVIKTSKVYQTVRKVVRGSGATETIEDDPLYATIAAFEVDGKSYEAQGQTETGWFIPREGDRVRVVYVPGNPSEARVRYALGNEHWLSLFLMLLGIGVVGLALVPVYYVIRGKPFLGTEMPTDW